MEVIILIPKEIYNTCYFLGEGCRGSGSPERHLSVDSQLRNQENQ